MFWRTHTHQPHNFWICCCGLAGIWNAGYALPVAGSRGNWFSRPPSHDKKSKPRAWSRKYVITAICRESCEPPGNVNDVGPCDQSPFHVLPSGSVPPAGAPDCKMTYGPPIFESGRTALTFVQIWLYIEV